MQIIKTLLVLALSASSSFIMALGQTCGYTRDPLTPSSITNCNVGVSRVSPGGRTYTVPIMPRVPPPIRVHRSGFRDNCNRTVRLMGGNLWGMESGFPWLANVGRGDFPTLVHTLRVMNFNIIRLPFLFHELNKTNLASIARTNCNPVHPDRLANSLRDPLQTVRGAWPSYTGCPYSTTCNAFVPSDNAHNRYLWMVQYLVGQGFYVVIDFHPTKFFASSPDTRLYMNSTRFFNEWHKLWTELMTLPTYSTSLRGRLMVDIHNEPDAFNIGWPTWTRLAVGAASRLWRLDSTVPMLVSGTNQSYTGRAPWGDGFDARTDFDTRFSWCANRMCSSARPFFSEVARNWNSRPWVLTPHSYYTLRNACCGQSLWDVLQTNWGSKSCSSCAFPQDQVVTRPFPVIVGEVGYIDTSNMIPAADLPGGSASSNQSVWLRDINMYFRNALPNSSAFPHDTTAGVVWWSFNSAITVNANNTFSWNWNTMRWFVNLGLRPWYLGSR